MKTKLLKAFTLIELLIVIIIIWILATALIPRFTGMQDRARYARVQKDFRDFKTVIFMAQNNTNKTLREIVNDNDVIHPNCYSGGVVMNDRRTLPANHTCRTDWSDALRKIEAAAGMATWSLSSLETDPWWSPYGLDPNEWDPAYGWPCWARDVLYSWGPDGYIFSDHAWYTTRIIIPSMGCSDAY